MRTYLLIFLAIILSWQNLWAQHGNVTLIAQSADGKAVKLFWIIKHWNSSYTGFDIKRKEGLQNWVKLNTAPIMPGIWGKRKLAVSGNNLYEESLLKAKMFKLLKSRDLVETDFTKYLQKLNNDTAELQIMSEKMEEDYDIAMLNGFGYVDHSATKKTVFEYGLFIQGTDKMLAGASWNYGEIPDLDVVKELTSKSAADTRGIKVMWDADTAKMRINHIAGFNIYREGIRLNTNRITVDDKNDPSVFSWYDKYANNANQVQYSIAAESVFNIEGIIRSYAYDPAEHPKEYKKATVTEIASAGFYFKEGTSIKWSFPKEYERFIKGFYIEKENMPAGYNQVSGLLDPTSRSFNDKSESQVNGYIKVRVDAYYQDRTYVPGTERLYCYLPVTEPPAPQNIKISSKPGEKSVTINFTWDPPIAGDSLTDYYKVYAFDALNSKLNLISDQEIRTQSFNYQLQHGTADIHKYCITAISKQNTESPFSDTVSIKVPSLELPAPVIKRVTPDNMNKATIEWQYPDISDLKGFRLSQNGKIVVDEKELKRDSRQYVTNKLDEGATYEFLLIAVSENGVLSDNTTPFHVVVNQTSK